MPDTFYSQNPVPQTSPPCAIFTPIYSRANYQEHHHETFSHSLSLSPSSANALLTSEQGPLFVHQRNKKNVSLVIHWLPMAAVRRVMTRNSPNSSGPLLVTYLLSFLFWPAVRLQYYMSLDAVVIFSTPGPEPSLDGGKKPVYSLSQPEFVPRRYSLAYSPSLSLFFSCRQVTNLGTFSISQTKERKKRKRDGSRNIQRGERERGKSLRKVNGSAPGTSSGLRRASCDP
ncbi:hypothetical protein L249_3557 [Ophiocordyceps polyrhachis-furcata BCC 54312]|uniref:Uncharacterized protein n=1 Tax=Ophiocordyceps polyrhachis-furcata BCC 54312 TaxID=1330021 RepID=A0A367LMA2_9HYPO|nr:hypothetical protein L249_3557 [Ophiocordyceps polyrhachis-furcata BCC 54312]